jgi:hypothetical protein
MDLSMSIQQFVHFSNEFNPYLLFSAEEYLKQLDQDGSIKSMYQVKAMDPESHEETVIENILLDI